MNLQANHLVTKSVLGRHVNNYHHNNLHTCNFVLIVIIVSFQNL